MAAVVCALSAPALFAQGWPLPAAAGSVAPAASCPGCPAPRTNVPDGSAITLTPTWPYSDPITTFTGRFLDSAFTQDFQQTFRTARAWNGIPVVARNRIYFMIGSAVASYDATSFFNRLEWNQWLLPSSNAPVSPSNYRPMDYENERFLGWDKFFYVENTMSGWYYQTIDRQQTMWGFDVDDRGYVYIAAADEGWGLVQDDGSNGGGLMPSLFQSLAMVDVKRIASIKTSGGNYYALIGNGLDANTGNAPNTQVWDVTQPAAPAFVRNIPMLTNIGARSSDHSARICDQALCIYANDALVAGGAPLLFSAPRSGRFTAVASDGQHFFATFQETGQWGLAVLTPDGTTYTETDSTYTDPFQPSSLTYGASHLVITGYVPTLGSDLYMVRLNNLQPELITFNRFFTYYYSAPPPGYANAHASAIYNAFPYSANGKVYLVICAFTLGDVYQINTQVCSPLGSPGDLSARASSSSSSVSLTWAPVANAGHYEVQRSSGGSFSVIAPSVLAPYTDTTASPDTAYLYKVRAVDSQGCVSGFSAVDLATTVMFTDDPIISGETIVKAAHIEELRTAINAVRALAGLPAASFTNPSLGGAFISAVHISELRAALNEARPALTLSPVSFTDSTISAGGNSIRAVHVTELRDGVR